MRKNLLLAYLLTIAEYSWFWMPIWVLYYRRFTNYTGIGLLESVLVITIVMAEIPTGAIADLLGKRRTMFLALLLGAIGNIIMGLAINFFILAVGIFTAAIGVALLSGAFEAFIFDSLVSLGEPDRFEKIISNISTLKMLAMALASLMGGFLYSVYPGLPFLTLGLFKVIGLITTLFMKEPPVDTDHFSWENYKKQTIWGFYHLFHKRKKKIISLTLICLASFYVLDDQLLIDTQMTSLGWSGDMLGIIVTTMFIVSAILTQITPFIIHRLGKMNTVIISNVLIGLMMIVSPLLGIVTVTILIVIRNALDEIHLNTAKIIINQQTLSKYRATALSGFSMLSNIPYVLLALPLGAQMDQSSVNWVVFKVGMVMLVVVTIVSVIRKMPKFAYTTT